MPRPKLTREDLDQRETLADQIKDFLTRYRFTEVKLAETLGISRRSVQMMKAGKVCPSTGTLRTWEILRAKYKRTGK